MSGKETLVGVIIELIVLVWAFDTWSYFDNPYQKMAVLFCYASVIIIVVQDIFKLTPNSFIVWVQDAVLNKRDRADYIVEGSKKRCKK
jgi:hypothetical protein